MTTPAMPPAVPGGTGRATQMPLLDAVEVGRRYRRAVNLERDAGAANALDGYLVTPAVRRLIEQIAAGLEDPGGDRAWSLVGPYGSGKSAFALFLTQLLAPAALPEGSAARRMLRDAGGTAVGHRLHAAVLTAERAPLDVLLLRSLDAALGRIWRHVRGRKPAVLTAVRDRLNGSAPSPARCAASDVVRCVQAAAEAVHAKTGAGLLLIIDEAGKALEFAAQQPARGDVYLLQALAEATARHDGAPLVVLTVLHQSFERYADHLDAAERNEWTKVQGRFGELAFREADDQTIRLTAAAVRRVGAQEPPADWSRLVAATAQWIAAGTGWDETSLAAHLDRCWPLHPVTAALLGPLFRGRLAQNERSLFAFLSAGEPLGFRDFLRSPGGAPLYTVDRLYDYATGLLGARLLSRDGRQWAEIEAALRRLPPESDAADERILKTVGLLGMLGERVGLRASAEIVGACLGAGGVETAAALDRLRARSLVVHRQYRGAFQLWEGSDLDLDALARQAEQQLPADFSVAEVLGRQAARAPIVARRHLFETGTLRLLRRPLRRRRTSATAGGGSRSPAAGTG